MKGFIFLLICGATVALCLANSYADDVGGDVWGTWTVGGSPYYVWDQLRIPPDSTLVIEAGVVVYFEVYCKFIVDTSATLIAVGNPTDSIIFISLNSDAGWHGIRFHSANNSSQLSYCRIEYGNATGGNYEDKSGGAIYCSYSSPAISNNTISNNSAAAVGGGIYCSYSSPTISNNTISNNSAIYHVGGGIYCDLYSSPSITNNTIRYNSDGGISCHDNSNPNITNNTISNNSDGGIYCYYNSNPNITNNTISSNSASGEGGGIYCHDNSNPNISSNTISNNSANHGGGIYCSQSSPTISGNTISNNSIDYSGGGIYCIFNSNPSITNNTISNNSTGGSYGFGGGISCYQSNPIISGNTISSNSTGFNGDGGGIDCRYSSSPTISGNTISNNSAGPFGGGIYCYSNSNPTIFNNTIGYNSAGSSGGGIWCSGYTDTIRFNVIKNNTGPNGGGIYLTGSNCVLLNNTVSYNTASSYGGGLYCNSSSPTVKNTILYFDSAPSGAEIWLAGGSNPSVTYCDIQGVWPGSTNIHVDPQYVDYWHGFYDLQWGSPCINAGDPALFDPDGTRSDMGALYHYLGITDIGMIPVNPPINVPAGGHFNFNGILQNLTAQSQTTTVWIKLNVPGYGIYGPIMQFNNIPIAAYDTLFAPNVRQDIPSFAPLGTYTYIAYCGTYPSSIIDSCYFGFAVTAPIGGSADNWNVSKWFEGNEDMSATIPGSFALDANYPNPFNAQTNITVNIPKAGEARLEIYNLLGQKVATLIDGSIEAGHHTITWDANEYSSGIYFYKLSVPTESGSSIGEKVFTKRMTLLK